MSFCVRLTFTNKAIFDAQSNISKRDYNINFKNKTGIKKIIFDINVQSMTNTKIDKRKNNQLFMNAELNRYHPLIKNPQKRTYKIVSQLNGLDCYGSDC
ncbi:hypothetical protein BpHYR1_014333 [Brachionus plicatilis]|uniref:Uncharacterized protein n=1 Tax=Brachionus plicatilis TaxID=10195 RepID=A0A3M7Q785_BRAPC|nr:hypothetical protein BpHYR1_014333 [Brachionus plicatilis]